MSYLSIEHTDKSFVRGNLASQVLKDINLNIARASSSPSSATPAVASRRC